MSDEGENVAGSGVTRWIPAAVVFTALGGFVSLAWYAYNVGTQSVNEDSILVVEADNTPMKEKPEDPGGMQFANQDKVIFETISGDKSEPPKVERILPAPEEPVASAGNAETTTWVNDKIAQPVVAPEVKIDKPEDSAASATPSKVDVREEFVKEAAIDKKSESAKEAAQSIKSFKQEKKAEAAKPAEVLDKAVKSTPKATGKAKAQLGAYGSEKEAKAAWSAVQKKFAGEVAGHDYVVVKADLGAKGIFYRLRVTGFADAADVKKFCAKLSAKGQACIPAAE